MVVGDVSHCLSVQVQSRFWWDGNRVRGRCRWNAFGLLSRHEE
jgi:hypothetical protein